MTGQLSALAQGNAAGTAGYTSKLLKTGQTTQYSSELDDGYYEKGVAKSYTVLSTDQHNGTTNIDLVHLEASIAVSFDATSKEIRGTGLMGVFKAAGGETIVVTGSASNNGVFTTKATGTADKIIVNETIVDESAGATVSIAKREAHSNNCVLDNNTGLMWSRYAFSKFGVAGTGLMPWTGVPYDIFAACAAANAASLSGYTDWRVPNQYELYSILDSEAATGAPDSKAFPSYPIANLTWSSTTRVDVTSNAIAINFYRNVGVLDAKTAAYCCVLVRGG